MDIDCFRDVATDLLWYAGKDLNGRPISDPVYNAITEHRQSGNYSSCADNAHNLYFRLGLRYDWINRAEFHGWKVGQNISLLYSNNFVHHNPDDSLKLLAGDVVIIGALTDPHVVCILNHDPEGKTMLTSEYGQPGGAIRQHIVQPWDGKLWIGGRSIDCVLSLEDLLNGTSDLSQIETAAEYATRLGLESPEGPQDLDPPTYRDLSLGDKGADVAEMQREISVGDDGDFGPATENALKAWQKKNNLKVTGIWGEEERQFATTA